MPVSRTPLLWAAAARDDARRALLSLRAAARALRYLHPAERAAVWEHARASLPRPAPTEEDLLLHKGRAQVGEGSPRRSPAASPSPTSGTRGR
eukprot:gene38854-59924_t